MYFCYILQLCVLSIAHGANNEHIYLMNTYVQECDISKSKRKSKKTLFKVGQCKHHNISFHLK